MTPKDKRTIQRLWEYIEAFEPDSIEEERKAFTIVIQREESLEKTLNKEQKELLDIYRNSMYELDSICQCEAFVKGVRFATAYLLDAMLT